MSTEVQDFLEKHQIPFLEGGEHRHVRYGWIGLQCPWCQTSSWHLGIRLSDGFCSCWRCGRHRIPEVFSEITGEHASRFYRDLDKFKRGGTYETEDRISGKTKLPEGIATLYDFPLHQKYVEDRGYDVDYLEDIWGVFAIGPAPRLSGRLFLPIMMNGTMVSWTTRAITDREPRYISAAPEEERYPHKHVLYGADLVQGNSIVVVEGPIDAWRIGPGAVAVMGLNVSDHQLLEISCYPERTICFDASLEAQRRANKLCDRLSTFDGMTQKIEL